MKLLRVAQTLNGWQRIWVVLAMLWLIAVVAIGATNWPAPRDVPAVDIYKYKTLSTEEFAKSIGAVPVHPSGYDPNKPPDTAPPPPAFNSKQKPIGYDPETGQAILGWDPNSGRPVFAPLTPPDYDVNKSVADYRDALDKALLVMRLRFVATLGAVLLVPLISLYALGWSVGWIRRGFAR